MQKQREGILVTPQCRLANDQMELVDTASRELLQDPGLLCYNEDAASVFKKAGAQVEDAGECVRVRIPDVLVETALTTAPSKVVLGAREPENRLILDAREPRVRFGTGSETNIWLDVCFTDGVATFSRAEGTIRRLCKAAHLCDNLEHLDFFIRCVNIRDGEVTSENKDVNKFLASLNNITKHVQAGLTDIRALNDVVRIGEIVAGGKEAFQKEPVLSFITCLIKSPMQIVDDTATKLMEISRLRVPVVISSCPMGGATGPFDEFAMVAQINAEVLTGVTLTQLVAPGAPVLYGAVPVRTRLDNLNDMYGAPEAVHYTVDCAQMARFYELPCYSTAGVGDSTVPGIQATVEKMLTLIDTSRSGAQYVHYAFGLLDRTNVFCPEQAVLDDTHIGIVKQMVGCQASASICEQRWESTLSVVREVMETDHKTYMYHLPLPTREEVYVRYPLEDDDGGALHAAHEKYREIDERPRKELPEELQKEILAKIPGVLPQTLKQ